VDNQLTVILISIIQLSEDFDIYPFADTFGIFDGTIAFYKIINGVSFALRCRYFIKMKSTLICLITSLCIMKRSGVVQKAWNDISFKQN
jgi:hypothetical protein